MAAAYRPGAMRTPAALLRLAPLLAAVVLATAGCVFPGLEPVPEGPLVTVETRGGECPNGPCGGTVAVERDGRVHATAPEARELGRLPENVRAPLEAAVRAADFDRLRSRPFTGECPVNVDGQEIIYTFTTASGDVRLASCEVEIDPSDPLFVAVAAALAAVGAP
jgi:hypothetical protein